jgi:hypothetical protein
MSRWEEIHGFDSSSEFDRFVTYLEQEIADARAAEVAVDPDYGSEMIFGGRWIRNETTGEVWRLVAPDFPFRGAWEPVGISRD